ncbi:SERTA domain-containing protein 1 [Tiliqua scincoides]|uniref:SERTA domain-containing protein 1 n=1 Tax=Tiliqua scincoides TaxID=71010 RepID=UPI0034627E84
MLAKGIKRKRSEEEAELPTATPSSSLFSISVSKLHQSLQHVEPNLRHLVLVANTLRRIQDEMQPDTAPSGPQQQALGRGVTVAGGSVPAEHIPVGTLQGSCRRPPLPPPPSLTPVDDLLLSSMDFSVFSTILEDLSSMEGFGDPLQSSSAQPEGSQLCLPGPEPDRTPHPCPGPLEILGPGGYLLEESLEGIFEDIDTSMYDCDLWAPSSLPSFKEAFSSAEEEEEKLDLADLDYLMDAIVGVQEP